MVVITTVVATFGVDDTTGVCVCVCVCVCVLCSVMSNSATPWTVTRQAPLSMESSRQEY